MKKLIGIMAILGGVGCGPVTSLVSSDSYKGNYSVFENYIEVGSGEASLKVDRYKHNVSDYEDFQTIELTDPESKFDNFNGLDCQFLWKLYASESYLSENCNGYDISGKINSGELNLSAEKTEQTIKTYFLNGTLID